MNSKLSVLAESFVSSRAARRVARLVAMIPMTLVACASPTTSDPESEVETVDQPLSDTNLAWNLAWHGGSGGGPFYDIGCQYGEVIVGLFGRRGNYVDAIGFMCQAIGSDGSLGAEYQKGPFGGGGGNPTWEVRCPQGEAVVGIHGRSGRYLDRLGIVCASPPFRGYPTYRDGGGGWGGSEFIDNCPHGYALRSIAMRWGSWMDGVAGRCVYFAP